MGDVALSYAEVKALATGNPLILEKTGIDNDVAGLARLRQAPGAAHVGRHPGAHPRGGAAGPRRGSRRVCLGGKR